MLCTNASPALRESRNNTIKTKLVLIVALSAIPIMSCTTLEKKVTGNGLFAKIGAASYSIFVWHQVLLAFYRYTISSEFTFTIYLLFLAVVALLSWITYQFIEQRTGRWLKEKRRMRVFYVTKVLAFICLSGFVGYIIFMPELYVMCQRWDAILVENTEECMQNKSVGLGLA